MSKIDKKLGFLYNYKGCISLNNYIPVYMKEECQSYYSFNTKPLNISFEFDLYFSFLIPSFSFIGFMY
jgi:hypothetical protein